MTTLRIEMPGPPQPWQRPGQTADGKRYNQRESGVYTRSLAHYMRLAMRSQNVSAEALAQHQLRVRVEAYFADLRVRDGDRVLSNVLDAGKGIVYVDDRWTMIPDTSTHCELDRANPRTVVLVEVIS